MEMFFNCSWGCRGSLTNDIKFNGTCWELKPVQRQCKAGCCVMGARCDVPDVPDAFFGMTGSLSAALISRIIKIVWENHTYSAPLTEGGAFYCQFCRQSAHVLFIPSCSCRKKQNCAVRDEHYFLQSFISFLNCWINSIFAFYLSICNMGNLSLPCSNAGESLRMIVWVLADQRSQFKYFWLL